MQQILSLILVGSTCSVCGVGIGFIIADWYNRKRSKSMYETFTMLFRRTEESVARNQEANDLSLNALREAVKTHEKAAKHSRKESDSSGRHTVRGLVAAGVGKV